MRSELIREARAGRRGSQITTGTNRARLLRQRNHQGGPRGLSADGRSRKDLQLTTFEKSEPVAAGVRHGSLAEHLKLYPDAAETDEMKSVEEAMKQLDQKGGLPRT